MAALPQSSYHVVEEGSPSDGEGKNGLLLGCGTGILHAESCVEPIRCLLVILCTGIAKPYACSNLEQAKKRQQAAITMRDAITSIFVCCCL